MQKSDLDRLEDIAAALTTLVINLRSKEEHSQVKAVEVAEALMPAIVAINTPVDKPKLRSDLTAASKTHGRVKVTELLCGKKIDDMDEFELSELRAKLDSL